MQSAPKHSFTPLQNLSYNVKNNFISSLTDQQHIESCYWIKLFKSFFGICIDTCLSAMDPASIIGLVDASIDLAVTCGSTVEHLNTLASQYKHARLTISSMVQTLDSLQLAWNRISVWSRSYVPDQDAVENGLVERLQRFLETGTLVMEALNQDLFTYNPDDLGFTQRSRLIWNDQVLQNHRSRLRDQATSMTLLLQAIQL